MPDVIFGVTAFGVVLFVLFLLWVALIIVALVQIVRSTDLGVAMKVIWAAIVFFFPFLGTIAWFLLGRRIGDPFGR